MTLANWKATENRVPSATHKGEPNTVLIHMEVGRALSQWEHLESGLTRLFQVLCETPHFAACRAYGVVESSFTKTVMLGAAADAFFARRDPFDTEYHKAVKSLFGACQGAQQYRNNIAHGIAVGFHLSDGTSSGYFLSPPSYATKKVKKIDPREVYLLGAAYWYNVSDIDHYTRRFSELLGETMKLIQEVNKKYAVLKDSQLHP
jgi:hypothetical protein